MNEKDIDFESLDEIWNAIDELTEIVDSMNIELLKLIENKHESA